MPRPSSSALTLSWSYGFSPKCKVHNLTTPSRTAIFYVSGHTGIIYDYASKSQYLLQGHCSAITCACVSPDKRWVVTGDAGGSQSVVVVWDAATGLPARTLQGSHGGLGVCAVAISADAMFVATLGAGGEGGETVRQELAVWEWTAEAKDGEGEEGPLYVEEVPGVVGGTTMHRDVSFNPHDPREIVTTGERGVAFWTWEQFKLSAHVPSMSKRDKQAMASVAYVSTVYVPNSTRAVTATARGEVVIWNAVGSEGGGGGSQPAGLSETTPAKSLVKTLRLCEGRVEFISTVADKYLVVAGEDGAVRFFDFDVRIVAWFEDLNAGPVTSVDFALPNKDVGGGAAAGGDFDCPDFVVGTSTSYIVGATKHLFNEIEPDRRRGVVLVQGVADDVPSIATNGDRLVIASYNGDLQLWDYLERTLLTVKQVVNRQGARQRPQCVVFNPSGSCLAVGSTSALLKVLDAQTLEDVATFTNGEHAITHLRFSLDGLWLATADAGHHVALYVLEGAGNEDGLTKTTLDKPGWRYVGRHKSHTLAIVGLEFTNREDGRVALVSVSADRTLVEYDLGASSVEGGVVLRNDPVRIEAVATPTAAMWHPLLGGDFEDRVVTANDEFKFKQWNADNKSCRRTSLCPTYGGPLNALVSIPMLSAESNSYAPSSFIAYSTAEKVVGLTKLPLDGNPCKSMGLIAHPTAISALCVTGDGRFVITAGGSDRCVNVWSVDCRAIEAQEEEGMRAANVGAPGIGDSAMYGDLIDAETMNDLVDYFYYAQLRTQGEDTTEERKITGFVPLEEIPNLVRALGYYPSEDEVANMIAEVKYAFFTETGETQDQIDLNTFVKLFLNHRPVFGTSKASISDAFAALGGQMSWGNLRNLLMSSAERMTESDIKNCLQALLGGDGEHPSSMMDANKFADKILGFEEANDEDPVQDFGDADTYGDDEY